MSHFLSTLIICTLTVQLSLSQSTNEILDQYIDQAIQTNHSLQAKQFQLQKNILALEEAQKRFMPEIGFGASYTLATGGRTIQIPVGDLVNPVYTTLNQLTQSSQFPQIENVEEQFLPNNFYDARIRITQPIINREIYYNRKVKEESINLKQTEIQLFKRELVHDVKTAYFQYLQAAASVRIYDNALDLLAENQRVNESLLRNDKIIPSVLSRVESEITQVKAERTQAVTHQQNAAAYLNFLLNRYLDTPIETAPVAYSEQPVDPSKEINFSGREELRQLNTAQNINALVVDLEKAYKIPRVGLQIDIGSQNFDFEYGGYILGGLSVEVPLYAANRNKLQVQQAELDIQATQENINQVKKQIQLQIHTTQNEIIAARQTWKSYQSQLDQAQRQYRDTFRRYKEGIANYIELLDARTSVTNIELQQSLNLYNLMIKETELERTLASYPLP